MFVLLLFGEMMVVWLSSQKIWKIIGFSLFPLSHFRLPFLLLLPSPFLPACLLPFHPPMFLFHEMFLVGQHPWKIMTFKVRWTLWNSSCRPYATLNACVKLWWTLKTDIQHGVWYGISVQYTVLLCFYAIVVVSHRTCGEDYEGKDWDCLHECLIWSFARAY